MQELINSDLVKSFIKSAEEITATVEIVPEDAGSLNNALVAATGNEPVLLAESDSINKELYSKFRLNKNVITEPSQEQLANLKIGITDAFCGIASTGSVCVSIGNKLISAASMLTRKHIAVLESKNIIPKPRDIFSEEFLDGQGLSQSFTIITGPSATADMGPLVRGVHGPGKIHIIVLE